ncbi:MAG: 2Fe-2S iron-sulfur cluster-binding protein [Pseudonocardiaceae bacterium]
MCFARSGHRVPDTGEILLEQAEGVGLRPEFGCRMGICLTCTSHRTAGSVWHRYTGHNVLHGQCDFMRDEELNSRDFVWDMVSPPELWKRSHNFRHHAYTKHCRQRSGRGLLHPANHSRTALAPLLPGQSALHRGPVTDNGLPYNTGPLGKQLGSVFRKLAKLALPGTTPIPEQSTPPTESAAAAAASA